jgi:hypothetical protein
MKKRTNELNRAFSKEEVQMAEKHMKCSLSRKTHEMLNIPKENANQNYIKIPPHSSHKQQQMLARMWEKRNPVGGNVNDTTTMENSMEAPQKTKNRTAI